VKGSVREGRARQGRPRTGVRVVGSLERYRPGFEEVLAGLGYTPLSAANQLRLMNHLSVWLGQRGRGAADLAPDVVEAFLSARRACGYTGFLSPDALAPLLVYLRGLGVAPEPVMPDLSGPLNELVERYRRYLVEERGLVPTTVRYYLGEARAFLTCWVDASGSRLDELDAAAVTGFVVDQCAHRSVGLAKILVTALRSLLRFLLLDGSISVDLTGAVPAVAGWRGSHLPKAISPAEATALLASCDQHRYVPGRPRTGQGTAERARLDVPCVAARRDRAILLLLVRLGLRAGEVAQLRLDDLDWRHGEITIRGKGRRDERLPLPVDVGEAVVDYLHHDRPAVATKAVFIHARAPHTPMTDNSVKAVVLLAARRAGLTGISAHRLRHTAATQMLRAHAPLAEVGQVLRHRSAATTAIYAKVDRDRLRDLAPGWPGVPA
jgi:integrase/recombinase XerD